jgi:hypothetical protein
MTMRLIGLVLVLMALCIVTTAQAGNASVARKQIESSLLVTGTITVAPDGSVLTHTLDSTDDLGDVLTKFVNGSIDKWRFEPVVVDGQVVTAKVPMSLRLTAKPAEDGNMSVAISNTHFGKRTDSAVSDDVRGHRLAPPIYPAAALSSGGKGTVYMIVQIGRDGLVIHADAEQVNLRVVGNQREMDMMRELLAAASVRAAKQWTFNPPTTGKSAYRWTSYWMAGVQPAPRGVAGTVTSPVRATPTCLGRVKSSRRPEARTRFRKAVSTPCKKAPNCCSRPQHDVFGEAFRGALARGLADGGSGKLTIALESAPTKSPALWGSSV